MKKPKQMTLNMDELQLLLNRVEAGVLQDGDYEIIKSMVETIIFLNQALENKKVSIKRLLKMLFGIKTEKKSKVLNNNKNNGAKDPNPPGDIENPSDKPDVSKENDAETTTDADAAAAATAAAAAAAAADDDDDDDSKEKPDKKIKGHGRNGANKYSGAEREFVRHQQLNHGDPCPLCPKGKVYRLKLPGVVIKISAQAPLNGVIFDVEKLRCNLCGEVFTAKAPEDITGKHYDETAKAMIALLKYGCGFPWSRLAQLQASLGIPLPPSTQWDKVESAADQIYPAFNELIYQAAQGDILHNDDTPMKVLDLMQENQTRSQNERTGIFTTGIISILDENRKIALFFTGRNHAGENIADLYMNRCKDKTLPVQMCDALSRNTPKEFKIILCNCMTHARRNFVDVASNFPEDCRYVIETLADVYKNDAATKEQHMSPEERMLYHEQYSGPLMEKLNSWLNKQIDEKLVEPNSGLGQAISYMLKHWPELSRFLHTPGAPLDNNICEQGLKRAILHRKNSLFYKTEHGAYIGDMFMSLIHSCNLMKINPFEYLVALQKHSSSVFKNPSRWMPWNYDAAVDALMQTA